MTHDHNQHEHAQDRDPRDPIDPIDPIGHDDPRDRSGDLAGEPLNIAALLRAAADDEICPQQRARLAAHLAAHPDAESQIGFERALRDSCGRVMRRPCCPQALRARVGAMIETVAAAVPASSVPVSSPVSSDPDGPMRGATASPISAPGIEQSDLRTREQGFWSRSPMMGVAAALLIAVAGTLIWQSASFSTANAPADLNLEQASYYNRMSDFVVREHNRCCQTQAAQAKFVEHDIDRAAAYFSQVFGLQLQVPDLSQSHGRVVFYGGGDCQVPLTSRSGHLRFDAMPEQPQQPGMSGKSDEPQRVVVSLFISPDPGLLPLREGRTYQIKSKACDESGARLYAWISNGIQYLLVSEATDEMCARVRELMNAPTELGSI